MSFSIYLYCHPVFQAKYLMRMINFKFSVQGYLTDSHVIPQFLRDVSIVRTASRR